ncbi:glycosyltransferase family 77 protein (plasmid) [Pedobacter sp. BS3]|uniref:putative nucleotide-diphospho-sugar transferase n=1 Tax=Pedobacter sp. BS3 TaxID=2567937 RepID=UPI0011EE4A17|nr:putative nucleotide-diphospho-sugar transferase [Pedobacter sp. BS3]TZF86198.1 glycosyltransferase family 77 protein [Pedobacter sp. BS3]
MTKSKGVVYVASGSSYIKEAVFSATSFKKHNAEPICLITDRLYPEENLEIFDTILIRPCQYNYIDKLLAIETPYDKTIFLDTDTYVCQDLSDLYGLLDYTEFAIHQADEGYEHIIYEFNGAMPEFNTGVFAFRNTQPVKKLFGDWQASYHRKPEISTDQYHLRWALYNSTIRYSTFSTAYNFITYYPNYTLQKVKVLHGRPQNQLPIIEKDLNHIRHKNGWRRFYYPISHHGIMIYQDLTVPDTLKLIFYLMLNLMKLCKRGILQFIKRLS